MTKGSDIEDRLVDFGVRIVKLCGKIPSTTAGKHIGRQLVRSGTSPAPNYAEARGAESQKNFVHKLKIVLKKLNESRVWLKIIIRSELIKADRLSSLIEECDQLCKIIGASIQTSRRNIGSVREKSANYEFVH